MDISYCLSASDRTVADRHSSAVARRVGTGDATYCINDRSVALDKRAVSRIERVWQRLTGGEGVVVESVASIRVFEQGYVLAGTGQPRGEYA